MLFNSYIFILIFLPLTLIGYFLLNKYEKYKLALGFLFIMSLWFYGYFNAVYLFVIIGSVLLNFCFGRLLHVWKNKSFRKSILLLGLLLNIGSIFYFKYYDFFISNMNVVFKQNWNLRHILLPLGISFFTFQQISYIVDCYRDEKINYSFLEYGVFVTFFPQLIAGPIVLHSELVPQFQDRMNKKPVYVNLAKGLYTFSLGLGKKVLLADVFSLFVNYGYTDITRLTSVEGIIVALFYTLQLYFDFSGYCDMALGIGYMFNITLPINFNSPYKAVNIADFWDRWHMTLTRFFTQYVYIPLGGSRKGTVRTYLNTLIVFLVSGLWHGASWTFIFWGFLHGMSMLLYRFFKKIIDRIPNMLTGACTFLMVCTAWIFFRADSISSAVRLLKIVLFEKIMTISGGMIEVSNNVVEARILSRVMPEIIEQRFPSYFIILLGFVGMVGVFCMKNTQDKAKNFRMTFWKGIVTITLMIWSILSFSGVSEFLYFNF